MKYKQRQLHATVLRDCEIIKFQSHIAFSLLFFCSLMQ